MNILDWVFAAVVLATLLYVLRLHRRIRALRYCYLEMSDFAADSLAKIREALDEGTDSERFRAMLENEPRPRITRHSIRELVKARTEWWERKVKDDSAIMRRAGLSQIRETERRYYLEHLGSPD